MCTVKVGQIGMVGGPLSSCHQRSTKTLAVGALVLSFPCCILLSVFVSKMCSGGGLVLRLYSTRVCATAASTVVGYACT